MFCIQCGNKLPDDAAFCNGCGSSTKPSPMMKPTPSNLGKTTVQFNHMLSDPSMEETFNAPLAQFGSAQFDSNPQLPPTQRQTGPNQFNQLHSGPQLPPTQMAPDGFRNTGQFPPAQPGPNQYGGNPQFPPTQRASTAFGGNTPPPMQSGIYQQSSNPQLPPTQFGNPPPSGSTQYSDNPYSRPWQAPLPSAAPPPPPGALQQRLVRMVGPNLASNALFGVTLGGILAAAMGALAAIIFISIAHAIAPHIIQQNGGMAGEDIVDNALGIAPLHSIFRDGLQFFLVMNGVGLHTQYTTDMYSYTAPLNGFFFIPAIMLTFGGYIAAGTDVQNRVQSSLWRGISIAIPYTVLLFLMTTQANGCLPSPGAGSTGTSICSSVITTNGQLTMDTTTLVLFGVLWGALFGLLGASIKLARGQWRHLFHQYLRSNQRPQVVGSLVGSLVAIGTGSVLAFLVVVCTVAYTSYSLLLIGHIPGYFTNLFGNDWASLTLWTMAQGPLYALNVFFLSMNAPVSLTATTHVSVSLFGSTPQLSPWFRLLLAIPVIGLFLGGRASAAIGRAKDTGAGVIQGALIAIPFTILIMLLTLLTTINTSYVPGSGSTSPGYAYSAGVAPFDVFLWALLFSAILGALGGAYQTSTLNRSVSQALAPLANKLKDLSKPGYALAGRLSKQPGAIEHTSTKDWLFSTGLVALILLIGAAIVGGLLIGFNQMLTLDINNRLREIASVVLIAIPGLLLLCAVASALRRDPTGGATGSVSTPPPLPVSSVQPVQPMQSAPQYPQYPQYPQF